MLDVHPPDSLSSSSFTLIDAMSHPTLISPRIPLARTTDGGLATCVYVYYYIII